MIEREGGGVNGTTPGREKWCRAIKTKTPPDHQSSNQLVVKQRLPPTRLTSVLALGAWMARTRMTFGPSLGCSASRLMRCWMPPRLSRVSRLPASV